MTRLQINQSELHDIAETVLRTGNTLSFKAHGTSMFPFIQDGDTVYLQRSSSYRVGDVVLVKGSVSVTLHRIVAVDEAGIITMGDGAVVPDPGPVAADAILGKACRVSGKGVSFHLRPPFSRLFADPRFVKYILRNRFCRQIGKYLFQLFS